MSQICSKMITLLFSAYFGGHFVTIATVKVKLLPDFYKKIGEKQFSFFSLKGGQNSPLMNVALL